MRASEILAVWADRYLTSQDKGARQCVTDRATGASRPWMQSGWLDKWTGHLVRITTEKPPCWGRDTSSGRTTISCLQCNRVIDFHLVNLVDQDLALRSLRPERAPASVPCCDLRLPSVHQPRATETLRTSPPVDNAWILEVKFDGWGARQRRADEAISRLVRRALFGRLLAR